MNDSTNMIPTRIKISHAHGGAVGQKMAETLTAQWGLANARRIIREMVQWVKTEQKRRKELENKI